VRVTGLSVIMNLLKDTLDFLRETLLSEDHDIRAEAWSLVSWAAPLGAMAGWLWGHLAP
jgi:hypothetical protein